MSACASRPGLAASSAISSLLAGPPQTLSRTLVQRHAVGFGPLALAAPASLRPPHACLTVDAGLLARLAGVDHVVVGDHRLVAGDQVVTVSRWWDPRPRPRRTTCEALAAAIELVDPEPAALQRLDLPSTADPLAPGLADRLLGRGPGLTPAGDDVLVGLLVAAVVLPASVGMSTPAWVARLAEDVRTLAPHRTTDLSARLLHHAAAGAVMAPVARLLEALMGLGPLEPAARELQSVGHSSGPALLLGVVSGARHLAGCTTTPQAARTAPTDGGGCTTTPQAARAAPTGALGEAAWGEAAWGEAA